MPGLSAAMRSARLLNPDFRDMLFALSDANADFLLVGAYAMSAHGNPRATGDIDLWVRPTAVNAAKVWQALLQFRAPMSQWNVKDFEDLDLVFQIGMPPNRIDLLTSIDGVEFEDAWQSRIVSTIEGRSIPVIGREALIRNKRASGRPKDLVDVQWLEAHPPQD
jgi:hypothetical protein